MKIQCRCGAKYAFDVTPEMAYSPVQFVCQHCGLDTSEFVNELIRQELAAGAGTPPTVAVVPSATEGIAELAAPAASVAAPVAPPTAPVARARIAISKPATSAAAPPAATAGAPAAGPQLCTKHAGQPIVERCYVCQKPLCPKCMDLFGYLCSPVCKAKAASRGIAVPEFAGQASVLERKRWRRIGLISGAIGTVVLGLLAVWFWYAWFGSVPHKVLAVRFEHPAYSGSSQLTTDNQYVFLHGGTLARYDVSSEKPVWSVELINRAKIKEEADLATTNWINDLIERRKLYGRDAQGTMPNFVEGFQASAEQALDLHVHGKNIWLVKGDVMVRYDWDTGKPGQEVTLPDTYGTPIVRGGELLYMDRNESGKYTMTHVSLETGDIRSEAIGEPPRPKATVAEAAKGSGPGATRKPGTTAVKGNTDQLGGLPTKASASVGSKPLDPKKVVEDIQKLSAPAKIALPATLSATLNQSRALKELEEDDEPIDAAALSEMMAGGGFSEGGLERTVENHTEFMPASNGYVQYSVRLIEEKWTPRQAMKAAAPQGKSQLETASSVANTAAIANEILNDLQRSGGGDVVMDDESRYEVTVHRPDATEIPDWVGEVVGPPAMHVLHSVNVVGGGKSITVLDKSNKKLWEAQLSYKIHPFDTMAETFNEEKSSTGQGPCVEKGDALYVFDEATLIAYDLKTGAVRWRMPSVGIVGLIFDDKGMLYVNTTSAGLDSVKYSRQIDITADVYSVVMKIDPKDGKLLWSESPGGLINRVVGKYIYVVSMNRASEQPSDLEMLAGEGKSFFMVRRLNPKNGHSMFVYVERGRCPIDVQFKDNTIELVYRKEVQVLKFLSFH